MGQNDSSQVDELTIYGVEELLLTRALAACSQPTLLDKALTYLHRV